jgi:hypothetical protein
VGCALLPGQRRAFCCPFTQPGARGFELI